LSTGAARGLPQPFVAKIRRALFALDGASSPAELDLPGFGMHRLTGDLAGHWSMVISRNWRIVFRFDGGNTTDVDFIDYH
jgi:proteic killer suppression protein